MVWNTNDMTEQEEDKHWEMSEDDTDDEFDDVQLSRLGIEIPDCAREDRFIEPLPNEGGAQAMTELIQRWRSVVDENGYNSDIMDALQSIQTPDGSFHFGDDTDPFGQRQNGIDPIAAGLDGAEETSCEQCGERYDRCECFDDDVDDGYYDPPDDEE